MASFDPGNVDLSNADPRDIICFLAQASNAYSGSLGARVSAIFVVLIASTAAVFFPVLSVRVAWLRVPRYVYLICRFFGSGVIIATAFIHLLDPAYNAIGPNTCVGMTGGWSNYSWPPAIALTSLIIIFCIDFAAKRVVEIRYGRGLAAEPSPVGREPPLDAKSVSPENEHTRATPVSETETLAAEEKRSFSSQLAPFLILEFGVIFHSVIIGLNLGVAGHEFVTLYPVIVFHQSFEGLGVGSRLSTISFPKAYRWLPYILCLAYGITTPLSIAIGLGLRHTYNGESYTAHVVSGLLDSTSAGILLYTGLVEMLAWDFLHDPRRTDNNKDLVLMMVSLLLGVALMALLGKWA